ncbi:hypothetical protein [Edaphocola flava]|uniref:hypothetical protein n=1 Tax=Edaphocola flava TaxID=2499629 RepID=UPI00100A7543|nr:hypothetical protein [Edaphocola flava]
METSNGNWIASPLIGAKNARQLGARASDIKPQNGIVGPAYDNGKLLGLSVNSSYKKAEDRLFGLNGTDEYKNKEGAVGVFDKRFLPDGLSAIEDNKTTKHVTIYPNRSMSMDEYIAKLNSINWIPVKRKSK